MAWRIISTTFILEMSKHQKCLYFNEYDPPLLETSTITGRQPALEHVMCGCFCTIHKKVTVTFKKKKKSWSFSFAHWQMCVSGKPAFSTWWGFLFVVVFNTSITLRNAWSWVMGKQNCSLIICFFENESEVSNRLVHIRWIFHKRFISPKGCIFLHWQCEAQYYKY